MENEKLLRSICSEFLEKLKEHDVMGTIIVFKGNKEDSGVDNCVSQSNFVVPQGAIVGDKTRVLGIDLEDDDKVSYSAWGMHEMLGALKILNEMWMPYYIMMIGHMKDPDFDDKFETNGK